MDALLSALVPPWMSPAQAVATYSMILLLTLFLFGTLYMLFLMLRYPNRGLFTRSEKERPDLPLVPGAPLLGNLPFLASVQSYLVEAQWDLVKEYKKAYRMTVGAPVPSFMTFNGRAVSGEWIVITTVEDLEMVLKDPYTFTKGPDFTANQLPLLGHGIFSSDGTRWHAQRKLASRIFSSKLFREAYEPVLQADARKVVAHLRKAHELGAKIDLQMLLLRSTMDSFLTLAMGVHLNSLSTLEEATVEKGRYTLPRNEFGEAFDSLNSVVFKRNTNPLWNIEEPLMGFSGKVARWKKTIDEFALDVIRERKKKVEKGEEKKAKDLLDLFMEDGELGEEELRDVVVNFLIAGRDTTAQSLCWLFRCLSGSPDVESRLRVSLPASLPSYDDLPTLLYPTAVWHETLRLHPNVPINIKLATENCQLPSGAKIFKGDEIVFSPWIMGRLESIWPRPLDFNPDRWIEDGRLKKESNYKWSAFNAGPRLCMGVQLATFEAMTLLSAILPTMHLELVDEDSKEKWAVWNEDPGKRKGRMGEGLTLSLRGGLDVKVEIVG